MLALLCHCPPSTGLRVQLFAETSLRSAFPVLKYRTALLCTAVRPPSRFHWRQPARLVCTQVYCHPMAAMEDTTSNTRGSPFVVDAAASVCGLTSFPIKRSVSDSRRYRSIQLDNGLVVVLVHDPEVPQAAACMNVGVGSGSDPEVASGSTPMTIHGIAHFLEHMCFMGSAKFPAENGYKQFLNKHGGGSNASTSVEHTQFFFHVRHEHLQPALDRFAQFFVAPLLSADATDRELNAVHSEYSKNLQLDSRRLYQLLRHCSDPGQPFSKFGTGSKETLQELPADLGVSTRELLLEFHSKYYSANLMRLCVIGREDLDMLERMVADLFAPVPNTNATVARHNGPAFTHERLGQQVFYRPIRDLREVRMHFQVPFVDLGDMAHSNWLVSHVIGHEGPGSLLSLLRKEGFALGLSASTYRHATFTLFSINIKLTEAGLRSVDAVVQRVFEFVALFRSACGEDSDGSSDGGGKAHLCGLFEDLRAVHDLQFRFRDKPSAVYTVKDVARQLHYFAPSDVFTGPRLTGHFNLGDVRQLLHALVPANLLLTVVGRETPEDVTIDSVEPWYRADYHKRPFSVEQRKAWCRAADAVATSHPDLRLCGANPFIPTKFNLHNTIVTKEKPAEALAVASVPETEVPFLLQDGKDVRVWHLPDAQFGLPKSSLRMSVVAPGAVDTPTSHALSHLYAAVVREMLVEPAYDAGTAGYHYGIGVRPGTGLTVSARGFTDKLGEVLQMVLRVMVHGKHGVSSIAPAAPFDFDDDVFARQRDKYIRGLRNQSKQQPYEHTGYQTLLLLHEEHHDVDDLLVAAEAATSDQLRAFV